MAKPIASDPAEILLAINKKLIDDEVFGHQQHVIAERMNPPIVAIRADTYSIVFPITHTAYQPGYDGAGRQALMINGRIDVYPRTRVALDKAGESKAWFTDDNRGILNLIKQVCNSLVGFMCPTDAEEPDHLLIEPMRLLFFGEARRRWGKENEWGDVVCEFSTLYYLNLTVTETLV